MTTYRIHCCDGVSLVEAAARVSEIERLETIPNHFVTRVSDVLEVHVYKTPNVGDVVAYVSRHGARVEEES